MVELPSGTVTFVFTDLVVSTRLWEQERDPMSAALARHDEILRAAIAAHGGTVVKGRGDGVHAVFATAAGAVRAAIEGQLSLGSETWPVSEPLLVRVGIHTGVAELRDGDYFGSAVNRAARLEGIAHGGQIVMSHATEALVRDELGNDVELVDLGEHRLRDLSRVERVFQVCVPGLEGEFPPLASLDAFPGNLPLQVTSFIGREREVDRVIEALDAARVVTLTGVGGVGKTRLAFQVAAEVLDRYRFGAWLCELAPVRSTEGVLEAVTNVLDVTARSGQTLEQALVEFLRDKELLLVLDNCEHVLDEAADLAELLERSCPRVAVLATSREGLGIDGERILAVPSLGAPSADALPAEVAGADAVQLFVDRARAVGAELEINAENAESVGQVCRRLDGVPLAIELAAARVPAMNPRELATRLDQRFQVLAGGRRGKIERHQTLRAVIDWSYDLLSEAEQRLLDRVTVFSGGWTLEAAEAVCSGGVVDAGAVFELTERLVGRSLVVAEDHGFQTRYRLLETIRQYGEERLAEHGDTDEFRRRHTEYFIELAGVLHARLYGPDQVECHRRLDAEHENFLAVVGFAVDALDADRALRLVRSLPHATLQIGYALRLPMETLLELPGAPEHPEYPYALALAAWSAGSHGDRELAEQRADEALAAEARLGTHPDGEIDAVVLIAMVWVALSDGAWVEAGEMQARAAAFYQSAGQLGYAAGCLSGAATLYATGGDVDAAIALATEGLALARQVGPPVTTTMSIADLANALAERDPDQARALLHEAIERRVSLGVEMAGDVTQNVLVAANLQDWPSALELAARAIPLLHWDSNRPLISGVLNVVARAVVDEDPESAAVIQGAARQLALPLAAKPSTPSTTPGSGGGLIVEVRRDTTRRIDDALGGERRRQLRAEGDAMDEDQAVTYALDVIRASRGGG